MCTGDPPSARAICRATRTACVSPSIVKTLPSSDGTATPLNDCSGCIDPTVAPCICRASSTRESIAPLVCSTTFAQLFFADPRQFLPNNRDFVIGCCDQDHPRCQDLPRHSGASFPCSNEPNGPPRARVAAGNDCSNLPPQLAEPASQRSSDASRPDDRQAIWHPVLG